MTTLTVNQQATQNTSLFNMRMSNDMTRQEVLEFCKRARISVCCDLIDDEVKEDFHAYYGYMPLYNINSGNFTMIAI